MRYSIKRRNKKAVENSLLKAVKEKELQIPVKACPKCGSDHTVFLSNRYLPYNTIKCFCLNCRYEGYTATTAKVFWNSEKAERVTNG